MDDTVSPASSVSAKLGKHVGLESSSFKDEEDTLNYYRCGNGYSE